MVRKTELKGIKCPSCNKTFIGEEEYTHECDFDLVEIPITDYYERNSKIIAWGINGKVYRLIKGISPKRDTHSNNPETGQYQLKELHGPIFLRSIQGKRQLEIKVATEVAWPVRISPEDAKVLIKELQEWVDYASPDR